MFGRKKKAPASAARDALVAAHKAVAEGRQRLVEAEARVERLQGIIAAEASAQAAVQAAVASDGGRDLVGFAAGEKSRTGQLVVAAETAARAAGVARAALPAAEANVHEAGAEVLQLDDNRKRTAARVLVAHADAFGQAYAETFRKLCEQHDELVGIGRALGALGRNITLVDQAIEAPRFELPSLPAGEVFTTYLRHVPRTRTITTAQTAWSHAGRVLAEDPMADVAKVLRTPAIAEVEGPSEAHLHRRAETAQAIPEGYIEVRTGPRTTSIVPVAPQRERPPMRRVYGGDAA
jgi:hypothetical protein